MTVEVTVKTQVGEGRLRRTQGSFTAGSPRGRSFFHCPHTFYNTSAADLLLLEGASGPCPQHYGSPDKYKFQAAGRFCVLSTFELFTAINQRLTYIGVAEYLGVIKKCNLEGKPNAPRGRRRSGSGYQFFCSLSSNPIPGLRHHRHLRSELR